MAGMADSGGDKMDGTFVLDTYAEVVSINNEEGPQATGAEAAELESDAADTGCSDGGAARQVTVNPPVRS